MAYKIVRLFQAAGKRSKVIRKGLTKKEAQAWCSKDSSRGKGWFDSWTKE